MQWSSGRCSAAVAVLMLAAFGCGGGNDAPATTSSARSSPATTNVAAGRLTVQAVFHPVCGPDRPSDPTCPDVALDGVTVTARDVDTAVVHSGRTDASGRVSFHVPPGAYEVRGTSHRPYQITPEPQTVTVEPGAAVTVQLLYASNAQ